MTMPNNIKLDICDIYGLRSILAICIVMTVLVFTQLKSLSIGPTEKGIYTIPSPKCANKYSQRKDTRILCLILASRYEEKKMTAISKTWAKRCDKHLFINGRTRLRKEEDTVLNVPVPEKRENLKRKVQRALEHVYRTHTDRFDWILKSDTDTYIIMENLRHLLSLADSNNPGYLGFHMKTKGSERNGYMSGGAAYAISWQGLHQLIHKGFKNGCCEQDDTNEDLIIGLCLAQSDVPVLNSQDREGKETFHADAIQRLLYPPHPKWIMRYAWNTGLTFGSDCCSSYSISFHRASIDDIFLFEHLLYKTKVYNYENICDDTRPIFNPHIVNPAY